MKKKKALTVISWVLVAICMGVIFYFSSQNADDSALLSDELKSFFGLKAGIRLIRKCAHFLEFTGLAVLAFNAFYQSFDRLRPVSAFLLTAAYAVTDELHQIFVEGRACRLFDVFIDCLGALAGITALYILIEIYKQIKSRRRKE